MAAGAGLQPSRWVGELLHARGQGKGSAAKNWARSPGGGACREVQGGPGSWTWAIFL